MGRFMSLLKKEWRQTLPMTALMVAAGLLVVVLRFSPGITEFFHVTVQQDGVNKIEFIADGFAPTYRLFLALLVPVLFLWLPGWAAWQGYHGFRQEWSSSQSHLLMSLPVTGWQLVAAKLAVAWSGILLYGGIAGAALIPLAKSVGLDGAADLSLSAAELARWGAAYTHMGITLLACALIVSMGIVLISQWSWIVGRAVGRWEWAASLAALVSGFWLMLRAGIWGGRLLGGRLPEFTLLKLPPSPAETAAGELEILLPAVAGNSGAVIGVAAAVILIYAASSLLMEHVVEV